MVLRFLLIKYVWLIVFTVFSLKYGLLSGYELLGFWAIFMLRRTRAWGEGLTAEGESSQSRI